MIKVQGVSTFYGEFQTIKNVSLSVEKGELVAIMGPNGHGKSTLLKTICGLLVPQSGSVSFDGTDITGLPSYKIVNMGLIYVAEDRHLFPEMTVLENLKMGAYCKNARRRERENLQYVFNLFPRLKERQNQMASTLSGGEARMLALGRGLMSNARLLAVDEPSLGLAPKIRMEVFEKIREINQNGTTVLMVEQSIAEAFHIVDRFYLMEDGRIAFEGTGDQILTDEDIKKVFMGV